jgi:phospholipase D1/2
VDGIRIENGIADALVERAVRAHKEGTPWRACIMIPLLPGYSYPIDSNEASSLRLIAECQHRTISRGTNSIFSRLRKEGIDPDDYITFFSLRGWGKFKSGALCTEQVYIHAKTCIIDDRLVLCGSANINERSQRGDRDSELLAVVRDTDMIDGYVG